MVRWWSSTTADGHERIQNEAIRQKHRPGSLKHWLRRFITAAFIWTHDIKLEIRAINEEDTTLLYTMFVYKALREEWRRRIRKFADTTVHTYTYSYRIKKFPLWRAFSKISGYSRKIRWIRVDASRIRKKKFAFSQISGYVWRGRCTLDPNSGNDHILLPEVYKGIARAWVTWSCALTSRHVTFTCVWQRTSLSFTDEGLSISRNVCYQLLRVSGKPFP